MILLYFLLTVWAVVSLSNIISVYLIPISPKSGLPKKEKFYTIPLPNNHQIDVPAWIFFLTFPFFILLSLAFFVTEIIEDARF
jgi:hypothetical protein